MPDSSALVAVAAFSWPALLLTVTAYLMRRRPRRVRFVLILGAALAIYGIARAAMMVVPPNFYTALVFRLSFAFGWIALVAAETAVVVLAERFHVHRLLAFLLSAVTGFGAAIGAFEASPISRPFL